MVYKNDELIKVSKEAGLWKLTHMIL